MARFHPKVRGARRHYAQSALLCWLLRAGATLPLTLIVASSAQLWAFRASSAGLRAFALLFLGAWLPPCPYLGVCSLWWRLFSYVYSLEHKPAESHGANGLARFVAWAVSPDFAPPAKGAGGVRRRMPLSGSCRGCRGRGARGHGAKPLFGTAVVATLPFFLGYRLGQR